MGNEAYETWQELYMDGFIQANLFRSNSANDLVYPSQEQNLLSSVETTLNLPPPKNKHKNVLDEIKSEDEISLNLS